MSATISEMMLQKCLCEDIYVLAQLLVKQLSAKNSSTGPRQYLSY